MLKLGLSETSPMLLFADSYIKFNYYFIKPNMQCGESELLRDQALKCF